MTDFARIARERAQAEDAAFRRMIELVEQATYDIHVTRPDRYTSDEIHFMEALVRLIDDRIARRDTTGRNR